MTESERLYLIIEQQRKRLGLSQSEVGQKAFGQSGTSAIQNIRRGSSPSADKLRAISDALDLEFYFGPKRIAQPVDPVHPLPGDVRLGDDEYNLVDRFEINVSAGPGLISTDERKDDRLAFSRRWLIKNGINAQLAGLVKVRGDSMEPTIPEGALVLVHMPEMYLKNEGIFAFSMDGEAHIKRLIPVFSHETGELDAIIIVPGNSSYPARIVNQPDIGDIRIVGRVRFALSNL